MAVPWRASGAAVLLSVRLTPRAGRDAIAGIETLPDGRAVLKARVRAVAENGKANDALVTLVAGHLGLPVSRVSLSGGAASRLKTLRIEADERTVAAAFTGARG